MKTLTGQNDLDFIKVFLTTGMSGIQKLETNKRRLITFYQL
jgi:hypothetical protein